MTLTYRGSDIEIRLGDSIIVKRFMRRSVSGIVCYVPGASAPHPQFEVDGLSYWAAELEDGTVIAWPYAPGELEAPRRVVFCSRGDPGAAAIDPSAELL